MQEINELKPNMDNVTSISIQKPDKTTYFFTITSEKAEKIRDINKEIYRYSDLMFSLIMDYVKGNYRKVPVTTIITAISAITYFTYPRRTVFDKIPGVKLVKDIGMIAVLMKSLRKDLMAYELWRENPEEVIE